VAHIHDRYDDDDGDDDDDFIAASSQGMFWWMHVMCKTDMSPDK
jgi:hypothetical protein